MFQQAEERMTKSIPGTPGAETAQVRDSHEMSTATRNTELAAGAMRAMAANGFGDALI